jgi:hypothetical protein
MKLHSPGCFRKLFHLMTVLCVLQAGLTSTASAAACPSQSSRPPVTDYWRTTFDLEDQELNNGNGYADRSDSSSLAWGEAYLLQGYLAMYRSYRDTWYLDKFVCHVDQMIATLSDPAGDGFLGWSTPYYSVQKVLNRQFTYADPADYSLPLNWRRWQSTSQTAYLEGPGSETYLVVATDPPHGWQMVEQPIASYVPNHMYAVSFLGRTNGVGGVRGRVDVYDATSQAVLASSLFADATWTDHALSFKSPAPGHDIRILCYQDNYQVTGFKAYFDNFSLLLDEEYLVHDGVTLAPISSFIKTVRSDPGLANYLAKANQYLSLIESNFIPKWNTNSYDPGHGIYLIPNDEAPGVPHYLGGTSLPHNQYLPWASVLSDVAAVTNNSNYRTRAQVLGGTFASILRGNSYVWNYADRIVPQDSLPAGDMRPLVKEDTSHGGVDVRAIVAMYRNGDVFGAADLNSIATQMMTTMWQPAYRTLTTDVAGQFAFEDPEYGDHNFGWIDLTAAQLQVRDAVRLAYQKVENAGFESANPADTSLPAGWQRWQSSAQTAFRSTSTATRLFGSAGVTIRTNPVAGWQGLVQRLYLEANASPVEYKVAFRGKTNGITGSSGRVDVYDATAHQLLNSITFTNTTWQRLTFTFQAPSARGHEIMLYLYQGNYQIAGAETYFDDVTVHVNQVHFLETLANLSDWDAERGVNRGFELADLADPTLPAYWVRWQSTAATAYRSSGTDDMRFGQAGLVVKTNPAGGWQIVEQTISYSPGKSYVVNFYGKTNSVVSGRVSIYDATSGQLLGDKTFSATSWDLYSVNFVAPTAAGHVLKIQCYQNQWNVTGGVSYFDEVEVVATN